MSISLDFNPVVKNINVRTMGIDDDRLVFADIKLQASVDPAELTQFLGADVSTSLWVKHKSEDSSQDVYVPKFPNLNQQSIKGVWDNIDCKLAPDESFFDGSGNAVEEFHGGEIRKVKFDPMNDSAFLDLEYTAQMPGAEIGKLIDRILDQQVATKLFSAHGELDL